MNIRTNYPFPYLVATLLLLVTTNASNHCNRSCPSFSKTEVFPYPFGFSAGCGIRLNCTDTGLFIGEFPVQSVDSQSITVKLQSRCDRRFNTFGQLYSRYHAPTVDNAILLRNCSNEPESRSCEIPNILVDARFQAPPDCSSNASLSCYSAPLPLQNATFLDYESVKEKGCKFLLSSISASVPMNNYLGPPLTLEVEVVELGWWMPGPCRCSQNSNCTKVLAPDGSLGYRCYCIPGFVGDGFSDGLGCRKGVKTHADKRSLIIAIVSATAGLILTVIVSYISWKKMMGKERKHKKKYGETINNIGGKNDAELTLFSMKSIIAATNNFSEANKLGQGGFGPVYKGILSEHQEVAMKRLSKKSGQGHQEFMNELKLIAKLQHTNLVRLLGCCIEDDEMILIYEYMPNRSLDKFLFDPSENIKLDWGTRFRIIEGIAQGVLYIHKHSRLKIIHRDLKASNVLLDEEMNPKISDFGMAKIFEVNQTEAITDRVVGTYGYMSPEYARYGHYSEKLDVFSFGVLLLEIVSGKRNGAFYRFEHSPTLAGWAWKFWKEGRGMEVIHVSLRETCRSHEALRCIHVAFLCVQESPADRPTMSTVIHMLQANESTSLPSCKEPAFSAHSNSSDVASSSISTRFTNNALTISTPAGR